MNYEAKTKSRKKNYVRPAARPMSLAGNGSSADAEDVIKRHSLRIVPHIKASSLKKRGLFPLDRTPGKQRLQSPTFFPCKPLALCQREVESSPFAELLGSETQDAFDSTLVRFSFCPRVHPLI